MDQRDRLKENPFSYEVTKKGQVRIFFFNRMIKHLGEKESMKLLSCIENQPDFEVQLALAKITGNFKHGNEKIHKKRK